MSDITVNECPNCGAQMDKGDKCCKYCGTANPNYKAPYYKSEGNKIADAINNGAEELKKKNVNIVVAILLFVFCWPIGVIYLIVKLAN